MPYNATAITWYDTTHSIGIETPSEWGLKGGALRYVHSYLANYATLAFERDYYASNPSSGWLGKAGGIAGRAHSEEGLGSPEFAKYLRFAAHSALDRAVELGVNSASIRRARSFINTAYR